MRSSFADPTVLRYHLRATISYCLIRENVITPMEPLEDIKPFNERKISPSLFA